LAAVGEQRRHGSALARIATIFTDITSFNPLVETVSAELLGALPQ